MNINVDNRNIISFINLQKKLLEKFLIVYPTVKDFTWLLDFPKNGDLQVDDELWFFVKHGKGIKFLRKNPKPEFIVDIHSNIDNPKLIDVWRLSQYFASDNVIFDEEKIKFLLDDMVFSSILKKMSDKQYELI